MSEPTASQERAASHAPAPSSNVFALTRVGLVVLMVAIALVGMSIAQAYQQAGWAVWVVVVLLYGVISMWVAWRNAGAAGKPRFAVLRFHIYHWVGLLVIIKVMYLLGALGYFPATDLGTIAVLLLALACYLAGVHLEPIFLAIGAFLAALAFVAAYTTENLWIFMVPLAVVAIVVSSFLPRWFGSASEEKHA